MRSAGGSIKRLGRTSVPHRRTVKQLARVKGRAALVASTRDDVVFEAILLHGGVTLELWGVVTFVVRRLKG